MKKLRITVDGKAYEVGVEILDEGSAPASPPPASTPVRSAAVSAPAAPAPSPQPAAAPANGGGPGVVVSPLAGKVVSIDVKQGDAVKTGDRVATIEAMKMNTFIYAECDGTVAQIMATAGEMVDEGAPLLQLN